MVKKSRQPAKVEQSDPAMGEVIDLLSRQKSRQQGREKVNPQTQKRTSPNKGYAASGRTREYLTEGEIDLLLAKTKSTGQKGRRHRNFCIILVMFRHGLRVGEAADLRWSDFDFSVGTLLVRRLKGSKSSTHFLTGDETRALRRLQRESIQTPFVFVDSLGKPLDPTAIAGMIRRLGKGLFGFPIHSHMLRHSCGHALAMKGVDTRALQDYLGHIDIKHTTRYTELSPVRFRNIWDKK